MEALSRFISRIDMDNDPGKLGIPGTDDLLDLNGQLVTGGDADVGSNPHVDLGHDLPAKPAGAHLVD